MADSVPMIHLKLLQKHNVKTKTEDRMVLRDLLYVILGGECMCRLFFLYAEKKKKMENTIFIWL